MNSFTDKKIKEVLDYLCDENLTQRPNTCMVRHLQRKGIEVFSETDKICTLKAVQDLQYQKILLKSFCRFKSRYDIFSRIQLTSKNRK